MLALYITENKCPKDTKKETNDHIHKCDDLCCSQFCLNFHLYKEKTDNSNATKNLNSLYSNGERP